MISASHDVVFDPRVLRPTLRARIVMLGSILIARILPALLITVLLSMAFWCGAVARLVMSGAPGVTPQVSSAASHYLAELTLFMLAAALLLAAIPWGDHWLLPSVMGAASLLGFVRPDLPQPSGAPLPPQCVQDAVSGFFGWGNEQPGLKLAWLSLLGFMLARLANEALGRGGHALRRGTTARRPVWWLASPFQERLGRLTFVTVTSVRIALAIPLVVAVQVSLLWSLLVFQSAVGGSEVIDQHTLGTLESGFAAFTPVLAVMTTAVLCQLRGAGGLGTLQCALAFAVVFVLSPWPQGPLSWTGPPWLGDLVSDVTRYCLIGASCWAALAGVASSFVMLHLTRRVFGWL